MLAAWSPFRLVASPRCASAPRHVWRTGRPRSIARQAVDAARPRPRARIGPRAHWPRRWRRPGVALLRLCAVGVKRPRGRLVGKAPTALTAGVIPAHHPAAAARIELDAHSTTLNGSWGSPTLPHDPERRGTKTCPTQRAGATPRTRKPRRSGAFCDAPKRTRTSTRLSRTRPSTWSPGRSFRPPRITASSSSRRAEDPDASDDLDVAGDVATVCSERRLVLESSARSSQLRSLFPPPSKLPAEGRHGDDDPADLDQRLCVALGARGRRGLAHA